MSEKVKVKRRENPLALVLTTPAIPEKWDYDSSVKKSKGLIYKWATMTDDLANELWIARQILSQKADFQPRNAAGTFVPTDKTWDSYCQQIGCEKRTVNRWLAKWFQRELGSTVKAPELPQGVFDVIYADPPWFYGDKLIEGYGAAEHHYPAMKIDELCQLDVKSILAPDAVLFLWVTSPLLDECWAVIKAWGFEYKSSFVWDKVKHNYGHYNSVRHEFLLVCIRGSFLPENEKLYDSVQTIERSEKHSEKPEEFRAIIETMYPHGRYLELFARTNIQGWEAYGNEV